MLVTDRKWAKAATKVVGGNLTDFDRTRDGVYCRRVWAGIVRENCPETSLKGICRLGNATTAHSTILALLDGWKLLPWRVRHGWLMMAENAYDSAADWRPSVWHHELHELAAMSMDDLVKPTPWHNPVGRIRRRGSWEVTQ